MINDQTYWFAPSALKSSTSVPTAHMLPNYDEYFIGFKDRSAILEAIRTAQVSVESSTLAAHSIVVDGQVVGGWERTLHKQAVVIKRNIITPLTAAEEQAVVVATQQYGAFLELPVLIAS